MRARSEATRDVHSGLLSMLGSKTTLAVVRELSWGILGRGEGGLKGIGASGSGYNEVLALGMLNVVDYVERGRCAKLPESASAPHPVVVALSSRRACVSACVHPHARVCGHVCIHMRRRACVRVHAYARAPVYHHTLQRTHTHRHIHVFLHILMYMSVYIIYTVSCLLICRIVCCFVL